MTPELYYKEKAPNVERRARMAKILARVRPEINHHGSRWIRPDLCEVPVLQSRPALRTDTNWDFQPGDGEYPKRVDPVRESGNSQTP